MLAFTPVDIGPVRRADEIYAFFSRKRSTAEGLLWNYYLLKHNTEGLLPGRAKYMPDLNWRWDAEFSELFPEFIAMIEALPFSKITFVNLIQNKAPVPAHQDLVEEEWNAESIRSFVALHRDLEPCIYRILIKGERENSGFFLARRAKETNADRKHFIRLPEATSTFAMNGTQLFHGAELPESDKLLCFISGFLDRERHMELIDRSAKLFSEYAIRIDDP